MKPLQSLVSVLGDLEGKLPSPRARETSCARCGARRGAHLGVDGLGCCPKFCPACGKVASDHNCVPCKIDEGKVWPSWQDWVYQAGRKFKHG